MSNIICFYYYVEIRKVCIPVYEKSDFYYHLPEELIAQTPVEPRNHSRLLLLDRNSGHIEHSRFYNLKDYLKPGDCLILNDTRVIPARLYGTRVDTNAVVEFVLLSQKSANIWEALAGPGKKAKSGCRFDFGNGLMQAEVLDIRRRQQAFKVFLQRQFL